MANFGLTRVNSSSYYYCERGPCLLFKRQLSIFSREVTGTFCIHFSSNCFLSRGFFFHFPCNAPPFLVGQLGSTYVPSPPVFHNLSRAFSLPGGTQRRSFFLLSCFFVRNRFPPPFLPPRLSLTYSFDFSLVSNSSFQMSHPPWFLAIKLPDRFPVPSAEFPADGFCFPVVKLSRPDLCAVRKRPLTSRFASSRSAPTARRIFRFMAIAPRRPSRRSHFEWNCLYQAPGSSALFPMPCAAFIGLPSPPPSESSPNAT